MSHDVIHKSFVIERTYPQPADRVYRAFSDPVRKRRWFAEGEGFIVDSYEVDFRVEGFERCTFRFGEDGPPMTLTSVYLDIVPQKRFVYAYGMTIDGAPLSSSLATMELRDAPGGGTTLLVTEHTAFLDGNDGSAARREGTIDLLGQLAKELDAHA
jgi:uncharacterized protein YndB with AHSA1/START domain